MGKVARATMGLMFVTILAKILGFIREIVLASVYGASMFSDAYLTAMNIPTVIFATIGAALGTTFIPIYFDIKSCCGEKKALNFTNNVFNIIIVICILLASIGFLFTEQIVKIFAIGFEGDVLNVTVNFTRILIAGIVGTGLSYIMTSYLQIKNNFIIPGLISVPRNIIIIISIILSIRYGPYTMVWGTLLGLLTDFLFQLPFAFKLGYRYKLHIDLKDKYLKKTIFLLGPVFIGVAVNQVNTMIDRTLASTLAEGSISALNYSNKLNGFIMALFIMSVTSVIYPVLSQLCSQDNKEKFNSIVVNSINSIILLIIPISIGAIVLSTPIVKLLFERGAFDGRATNMTSVALIMYSIGTTAIGVRLILEKVFYSLKDTKTPMINSVISMIINVIINLILIKHLKLAGLALGTSISSIVCTYLLFKSLESKIGNFGQDKILQTIIKSLSSSILMGVTVKILYVILSTNMGKSIIQQILILTIVTIVGFIVYVTLIYLLKVEEINDIKSFINSKLKNKY